MPCLQPVALYLLGESLFLWCQNQMDFLNIIFFPVKNYLQKGGVSYFRLIGIIQVYCIIPPLILRSLGYIFRIVKVSRQPVHFTFYFKTFISNFKCMWLNFQHWSTTLYCLICNTVCLLEIFMMVLLINKENI